MKTKRVILMRLFVMCMGIGLFGTHNLFAETFLEQVEKGDITISGDYEISPNEAGGVTLSGDNILIESDGAINMEGVTVLVDTVTINPGDIPPENIAIVHEGIISIETGNLPLTLQTTDSVIPDTTGPISIARNICIGDSLSGDILLPTTSEKNLIGYVEINPAVPITETEGFTPISEATIVEPGQQTVPSENAATFVATTTTSQANQQASENVDTVRRIESSSLNFGDF